MPETGTGYLYYAHLETPPGAPIEWIPLGSTEEGGITYGTQAWDDHFAPHEYLEPLTITQQRPEDRPENQCPDCHG